MTKDEKINNLVYKELAKAVNKFGAFNSTHEGIGIIREEYLELEKEVFKKQSEYDMENMKIEAAHVAAMAIRFMQDCCKF